MQTEVECAGAGGDPAKRLVVAWQGPGQKPRRDGGIKRNLSWPKHASLKWRSEEKVELVFCIAEVDDGEQVAW